MPMMRSRSMRRLRRSSRLDAMSGAGEDVRHVAPGSTVSTSRPSTSHSLEQTSASAPYAG